MKTIKVNDKEFELFISSEKIQNSIQMMAEKINADAADKKPLFIVILNGAFVFAADLIKNITIPCEVTFIKLSSYSGTQSTHVVREMIGLDVSLSNRYVIVVEDIIDTGITMEYITNQLKKLDAREVKVATLLLKPHALKREVTIDYAGLEIPNDFIVGYGLDYDGFGRNYPDIYKIVETS